jgi:hypothetical protein
MEYTVYHKSMAISIRKIMINDTILGYSTLFSDKHRWQWKILRTHFGHFWYGSSSQNLQKVETWLGHKVTLTIIGMDVVQNWKTKHQTSTRFCWFLDNFGYELCRRPSHGDPMPMKASKAGHVQWIARWVWRLAEWPRIGETNNLVVFYLN